jgi:hypothetical protein
MPLTTRATRKRTPHSGTSSAAVRASRIAKGIPELQTAVAAGLVTAYRGGEIAKLAPDQQQVAVAQWSSRTLLRTEGQRVAARAIKQQLRKYARVNLKRIAAAIRDAIKAGTLSG